MRWTTRTVGLLLGFIALAGTVVGQSVPTADVRGEGTPRFDPTQIVFKPGAGHVGLTLSVSGPDGYQLREEYEPGVNPTFSVRGLSDGLYSYELRIAKALSTPDDTESSAATRAGVPSNERGMRQSTKQPQDATVQSGHFQIEAGSLVLRNLVERAGDAPLPELETTDQTGLATKDICHNDDLIVDGSLCVGFDCICNQAFGFDTIVLRENNLRIFFDDTSTAASFPRNDWRIVINDSANGGASYFGIEDSTAGRRVFTIEAGARSHSLYVDDGGRVGIRTSTPSVELHVKDGDTPTLRLEQDGSSGFAPQTWDVAGNETNFFIRDVTHGSTLPFRIRPGAPTSAIDVAADGDVGIGTASPGADVHIQDTASGDDTVFRLEQTNNGTLWDIKVNSATGRLTFSDDPAGTRVPFKFDPDADNNLLRIGVVADDTVDITGILSVNGSVKVDGTTVHADYVFRSDYELESIKEHATFMWQQRHLPALPPAGEDGTAPVDLVVHQMGILEELEKAHIYIEQLHDTIKELTDRLEALEERQD